MSGACSQIMLCHLGGASRTDGASSQSVIWVVQAEQLVQVEVLEQADNLVRAVRVGSVRVVQAEVLEQAERVVRAV